jgi:tuftelin-interacting protein 11
MPRPSFKSSGKSKNYSAPIGFVAGGIQQSGSKPEEVKKKGDEDEDEEDEGSMRRGRPGSSSRYLIY